MAREILFRGFSKELKKWVLGDLCTVLGSNKYIMPKCYRCEAIEPKYKKAMIGGWIKVEPDSVGQFTGLTDKNGVKVFEGDIVKWGKYPSVCVFTKNGWMFESDLGDFTANGYASECEIIGNLFENTELMAGAK